MADTPDPVAAYLDEVRDRLVTAAITGRRETMVVRADAPRLLAALDAVLAAHKRDDTKWCDCGFGWPCATYRAVAAALLEEENASG